MQPNILDLSWPELKAAVISGGHPPFRARQLWQWLWRRGARNFADMTSLARDFREELGRAWNIAWPEPLDIRRSADGTVKLLLGLADGASVETVL